MVPYRIFVHLALIAAGTGVLACQDSPSFNDPTSPSSQCNQYAFTDSRDGRCYRMTTIGSQVWMAENLAFAGSGLVGECMPSSDKNACQLYGRLYTWAEVSGNRSNSTDKAQGACPQDWHMPSDAEWSELVSTVERDPRVGSGNAGAALQARTIWRQGGGVDLFGFSALPGGCRINRGSWASNGFYAFFWSASEQDSLNAWGRYLEGGYKGIDRVGYEKSRALSVRCIKDS